MKKDSLVIYKSKYGTTKQYALWIAQELDANAKNCDNITIKDLEGYDKIIFMGSLNNMHVRGITFITDYLSEIKAKEIFIIGVGVCDCNKDDIKSIIEKTLNKNNKNKLKYLYLKGALDPSNLHLKDKTLMYFYKKTIEAKKHPKKNEIEFLDCIKAPKNWVSKENIIPLLDELR